MVSATNLVCVNNQQFDLIMVEESFNLRTRGKFTKKLTSEENVVVPYDFFYSFKRFLKDDTFNIKIPVLRDVNGNAVGSSININNKISESISNDHIGYARSSFDDTIHHSQLEDMPFSEALAVNIGHTTMADAAKPENLYMSLMLRPQFSKLPQSFVINDQQVLVLKTLKEFKLVLIGSIVPRNSEYVSEELPNNPLYKIEKWYTYTIFVPTEIDNKNINRDVLDIYQFNEHNLPTTDDSDINNLSYKSSVISGDLGLRLDTNFKTGSLTEFKLQNNENTITTLPTYLGSMLIDSSTFYDYDAGKSFVGAALDSSIGEQIPLNFKGEYKRTIKFNFTKQMKDISINVVKNINQEILNPFEGEVVLSVKNSTQTEIPKNAHSISIDNLRQFRKRLSETKDYFAALQSLIRMGSNYE